MDKPKYFDFLDDNVIYNKINELFDPYEIKEEINLAREKIGQGSFYRAGTVSREILEIILFEGFNELKRSKNINSGGQLQNRINDLYRQNIIDKKIVNIFHNIRIIGNKAVHAKKKIKKEDAINVLKLSDEAIRYLIKRKLDEKFNLNLPKFGTDSIIPNELLYLQRNINKQHRKNYISTEHEIHIVVGAVAAHNKILSSINYLTNLKNFDLNIFIKKKIRCFAKRN